MTHPSSPSNRRSFMMNLGLLAGAAFFDPTRLFGAQPQIRTKAIPSTGERLPVIGMGSWITFDVPPVARLRNARVAVLRRLFEAGGAVVDSSPMYGASEEVIGYCLERLEGESLFSATKVWTPLQLIGRRQIERSFALWGVDRLSLLQVHNMMAWEKHLETILALKEEGRVRYVGITTSHGRRHRALEQVLRMDPQPFDFVQFTHNILDREAEARLLPLAADSGLAVLINRPFRRGALLDDLADQPLPGWAREIDCVSWPQFLLKFIVSHPAVTCAIPATTRIDHMTQNMSAAYGRLPGPRIRQRMIRHVEDL